MTTRQQGPCKNMQNKIHFFCFSPFWKSWINLSKWVGKTNFLFSMFHAIFVAVVTWNIESWCSKRRETIFVPVSRGKHGFLWKGNRLTWHKHGTRIILSPRQESNHDLLGQALYPLSYKNCWGLRIVFVPHLCYVIYLPQKSNVSEKNCLTWPEQKLFL